MCFNRIVVKRCVKISSNLLSFQNISAKVIGEINNCDCIYYFIEAKLIKLWIRVSLYKLSQPSMFVGSLNVISHKNTNTK